MAAVRPRLIAILVAGGAFLLGCAAPPSRTAAPAARQSDTSILVSSSPAAGSTISGPVDKLKLRFNPSARLDEVAISGPDGLMPMMVHSVGEVADYSIPLPGLGPGSYTVNWRATAQAKAYQGSVPFTVK
jgi:methionine-rich copper-binding protein CopC